MQLEWRDEAEADLFEILSYIAERTCHRAFGRAPIFVQTKFAEAGLA